MDITELRSFVEEIKASTGVKKDVECCNGLLKLINEKELLR